LIILSILLGQGPSLALQRARPANASIRDGAPIVSPNTFPRHILKGTFVKAAAKQCDSAFGRRIDARMPSPTRRTHRSRHESRTAGASPSGRPSNTSKLRTHSRLGIVRRRVLISLIAQSFSSGKHRTGSLSLFSLTKSILFRDQPLRPESRPDGTDALELIGQ
jgi:hypothetical protein